MRKYFIITLIISVLIFISCKKNTSISKDKKLISFVNPFIGTGGHGHTYPGATLPFGMMQLSPQTNFEVMFKEGKYNTRTYEYCAGYQYRDTTIVGFAHTNFSVTGHAYLGDLLLIPTTGKLISDPLKTIRMAHRL